MNKEGRRLLIIGYGNPARGDDGLGPALAEVCQAVTHPLITVDIDYQLTVEHAFDVTQHDRVVFVDAVINRPEPFVFEPVEPDAAVDIGSHSVSPPAVMRLARDLYGHTATAHILGISGLAFDHISEGLSHTGHENLKQATMFFEGYLQKVIGPEVILRSAAAEHA